MSSQPPSPKKSSTTPPGKKPGPQQLNLNPSARSFTPNTTTPPSSALTGNAYDQSYSDPADHRMYNPYALHYNQPSSEHPASAPNSAGSRPSDAPQTPPNHQNMNRHKHATPTPPAYTFADDDEYYPGTDPRLKDNARDQHSRPGN
ncbi:hypothetical protein CCHL11_03848 [Colletotrichum chlorophyti]|uniref:Uncharacterized protein n=1 Tax=Colletotrichum chlorophyti TaxID=708187 RepID=A0A1Q8RQZ3_9PEZI|nr:hypothetical protein CCHL11_03848 [Colletotrichum chlorophyti]